MHITTLPPRASPSQYGDDMHALTKEVDSLLSLPFSMLNVSCEVMERDLLIRTRFDLDLTEIIKPSLVFLFVTANEVHEMN